MWSLRRALGGAHLPPTKLFRRVTEKTILEPRIAAASGQANRYTGVLENRPKSENWASFAAIHRKKSCGNSLALVLQRGVNSISLQCIPWPVAWCEWGAWPTFDFIFSTSGIRTMIRIRLKSWSVCPCPNTCRHAKFHPNPCARFWVILLTDRQTDIAGNHIYLLLCRR